ncbi:uncharacterized protein RAG0_09049 [Rhynchosporium agropyri]|uniref:Uncharacterized protein n=1 Tax=Rhynchosporium agropyri TaxID=914238 RepID=A0A1E1KTM5_9HELO|nr:uncharacterized protein RAG0_09049 [Rhynchosporium agropyri]
MSSFCHEADLPPRGHWKARGVALNEVDMYLGILGEGIRYECGCLQQLRYFSKAGFGFLLVSVSPPFWLTLSYLGIRQKPNDTAFLDYMINVENSEDRYLDSSSIGWKEKWSECSRNKLAITPISHRLLNHHEAGGASDLPIVDTSSISTSIYDVRSNKPSIIPQYTLIRLISTYGRRNLHPTRHGGISPDSHPLNRLPSGP